MSEQDHLDALARGSQREEKKRKGDRSMDMMWEREKKSVFVTGTAAGMRYERTCVLSARGEKEKERNDDYSD